MSFIEIENVSKKFKDVEVLKNIRRVLFWVFSVGVVLVSLF